VSTPEIIFRAHAVQRMFERKIPMKNIIEALQLGETIEDYSADMPEPSRLILSFQGKRPFHLVASENIEASKVTVITVYVPSADQWHKGFKRRRA
jgi:hypothetical protein